MKSSKSNSDRYVNPWFKINCTTMLKADFNIDLIK